MKRGKILVFLVLILVLTSFSYAANTGKIYSMKLLAVQENENMTYQGSIADLLVELKPGSGRVFLETFPLTKMDTQISTRFAKDIACNYFNLNCQSYDFIYTIKANSNIIGGPSAGAAMSALTTIALLGLNYDKKTTVTGTINSGGILGPVGGTKEKIEAASKNGLDKVLIAKGASLHKKGNKTLDLINYSRDNLSFSVTEVGNLNALIFHLTGKKLKKEIKKLQINQDYQKIMKDLNGFLCDRTLELRKELVRYKINQSEFEPIQEKINNSELALQKRDHYSSASYCFGANILIQELIYQKSKKSTGLLLRELDLLKRKVKLVKGKLAKEKIETISDLQTLMIVKDRLNDVQREIKEFSKSKDKYYSLAYAQERFFSAVSWMYFFQMPGKRFVLLPARLKESCLKKISESEERYQYVDLVFRGFKINYIKEKIDEAKKNLQTEEYGLCLMKAVQAKAEANAILNAMGLGNENIGSFFDSKNQATLHVIVDNNQNGVFPILGYSYYQYANSLSLTDKHSSLLYLEYALEMSGLDIYFEKEEKFILGGQWLKKYRDFVLLFSGFVMGILVVLFVIFSRKVVKERRKIVKRKKQMKGSYSLIDLLKKKAKGKNHVQKINDQTEIKDEYKPRQDPKALLGKKR